MPGNVRANVRNTLFRCVALVRQVHAQVLRSKHPSSHLIVEADSFVSRLEWARLKSEAAANGYRRNIRLAPRLLLQPLKRVDKSWLQERMNKVMWFSIEADPASITQNSIYGTRRRFKG